MSSYENLLYEKQRCGVLITLNRPEKHNALSTALLDELDAALAVAKEDPEIRAVILTGAGSGFSAGEDLSEPDDKETQDDNMIWILLIVIIIIVVVVILVLMMKGKGKPSPEPSKEPVPAKDEEEVSEFEEVDDAEVDASWEKD